MEKKARKGKRKTLAVLSAVFISLLFFRLSAYASEIKLLETNVYDDSIYIYVKGISEVTSDSTVQIGNVVCSPEQISTASFNNLDALMKTIILIDNSKSIPNKNYADIQEILKGIISNSKQNEQIKIGTFSKEITYLCDYTSDGAILENVAGGITYNDQDTYLSDILYQLITELKAENTPLCTRIIILSDGADDNFIGYTNDEVRRYIEKNQYPIYTIGVLKNNNASELETMFSFSRAAKTDYFLLDGSISNEDIINAVLTDQEGVCLKITPDEQLKDGSNKNILLKLNTAEGIIELTANVDMPFGKGSALPKETEAVTEKQTTLPSINPAPVIKEEPAKKESKNTMLWIPIVLGIVIVLLLSVIIVLIFVKKKKQPKEKNDAKENITTATELAEPSATVMNDLTVTGDNVKALWNTPSSRTYLVLKNLDNTNIFFKVPIADVIHIGRRSTQDITLDDPKVSREHCEIILRGDLLYIKDCNSSNKTYYENVIVYGETPIISGGKVKIGSYEYSVELVKE